MVFPVDCPSNPMVDYGKLLIGGFIAFKHVFIFNILQPFFGMMVTNAYLGFI